MVLGVMKRKVRMQSRPLVVTHTLTTCIPPLSLEAVSASAAAQTAMSVSVLGVVRCLVWNAETAETVG